MSCVGERNSNRAATLSLKGRVDFTCLNCFNQTHFASAVGHELVDPKRRMRSFMEKGFTGTAIKTHFNPVVNFVEIRVFQACTCGQRFDLTPVPDRVCCALGALRKCAYFPFLVLHCGGMSLPLSKPRY